MAIADPIANEELRQADVPPRGAEWQEIVRFAQTYFPYSVKAEPQRWLDAANHSQECKTLADLRTCLFCEYRRYNHRSDLPNAQKMVEVYELLDRIRAHAKAG